MIITIDLARIGIAIAQMLMLFTLEFIAIGFFAKVILNKKSKVWERILGSVEIALVLATIFLWLY